MTIRHLKTFVTICECGTMTKAAEILFTAQPAVSATIAELEKYYGIALFDRINQRLVLTAPGQELLIKAKAVLTSFADFEDTAKNAATNPEIKIGTTLTIGKTLIPKIVKMIKEQYPHVQPKIKISKESEIENSLLAGELDFGMIEGEVQSDALDKKPFLADRLAVICGRNYPVPDEITLTELSSCPLLVREPGSASRNLLEQILREHNLPLNIMIESQSNEAILEAAKAGLGIAALSYILAEKEIKNKALREITVEGISLQRTFYLTKLKNKKLSKEKEDIILFCLNGISIAAP